MDLSTFLKQVTRHLTANNFRYALAGGLVASIYRTEERLTKDLDFLILANTNTLTQAAQIIQKFGLEPNIIHKADLEGGPLFAIKRKNTTPYMIAGREHGNPQAIGLDFILPEMPWFDSALNRAEVNLIDYGFGALPCLTVEDIIIAKFFSFQNNPQRFNDLDDLQSIFNAKHALDLPYLCGQMQKLKIVVPDLIKNIAPHALVLNAKNIR